MTDGPQSPETARSVPLVLEAKVASPRGEVKNFLSKIPGIRSLIKNQPRAALKAEAALDQPDNSVQAKSFAALSSSDLKQADISQNPDISSNSPNANSQTSTLTQSEENIESPIHTSPYEKENNVRMFTNNMARMINIIKDQNIETIFFLDKSARPIEWMLRDTWHSLFPKVEVPPCKFINIGQEKTGQTPSNETIDELRKRYKFNQTGRVLVVDESVMSGGSIINAVKTLHMVNPNAEITPFNFGMTMRGISTGLHDREVSMDTSDTTEIPEGQLSQDALQYNVRDSTIQEKKDLEESVKLGFDWNYRDVFHRISVRVASAISQQDLFSTAKRGTEISARVQEKIDEALK